MLAEGFAENTAKHCGDRGDVVNYSVLLMSWQGVRVS